MPNKLWFKAKTYGWGWTPVTWEGWVATLAYAVAIIWIFSRADRDTVTNGEMFAAVALPFTLATLAFLFVAYRTGERPVWRWGNPKTLGDALEVQLQAKHHAKKTILRMLGSKPQISNMDVQKLLNVPGPQAADYLRELAIEGKIMEHNERGKEAYYTRS